MKLLRILVTVVLTTLVVGCSYGSSFDRLPPLRRAQAAELRIDIAHYPTALRTAYVVKPDSIEVFRFDGSAWTARSVRTRAAAQVLDHAASLARLNGGDVGCNLYDGNSIAVTGAIEGARLAFTASNPDLCGLAPEAEDARSISRLLQMIERKAYVSRPTLADDGIAPPCFTAVSQARAWSAIRSLTPDRTVSRPVGPFSVVLQCDPRNDRSVDCVVSHADESPYPLVEAALTYASELETCSTEHAPFRLPMTFQD